MTEHYATHDQQEEAEAHAPYLKVWGALLVLTLMEYFYAKAMAGSFGALVVGLVLMAGIKAALVALYFMHVKYEGKWIYGLMIPTAFLALVLVSGLMPDIGRAPVLDIEDEVMISAPFNPRGPDAGSPPREE
jgi:cytochrome c oxidase subunit 4